MAARTAAGVEVARAQTNAGGAFSMRLPPGTYDILTLTTGILPSPASVRVTVTDGEVTQVQLSLDSGIR